MSSPITMKAPCTPRSHITYVSEECRRNALKNRTENEWFSHVPHTDATKQTIEKIRNGDDKPKVFDANIQKKTIKNVKNINNAIDSRGKSKNSIQNNSNGDYIENIKEPIINDYPNNVFHYSNVAINKQQKEDNNNNNTNTQRSNNNNKRPKNSLSLALNKNIKKNNKDLINNKKYKEERKNKYNNSINTSSDEQYTITSDTSILNSDEYLKNSLHNNQKMPAMSTHQTSSLRPLSARRGTEEARRIQQKMEATDQHKWYKHGPGVPDPLPPNINPPKSRKSACMEARSKLPLCDSYSWFKHEHAAPGETIVSNAGDTVHTTSKTSSSSSSSPLSNKSSFKSPSSSLSSIKNTFATSPTPTISPLLHSEPATRPTISSARKSREFNSSISWLFHCENNINNTNEEANKKNKENYNIKSNSNTIEKKTSVVEETPEARNTSICDHTNHTRQQSLSKDNNENYKGSSHLTQSLSYQSPNDSSQASNLGSTHNTRPSKLHFYGLDTNSDFESFNSRNVHSFNNNQVNGLKKNISKNKVEKNDLIITPSQKNSSANETTGKGREKNILDRSFNEFLTSPAMQQLNDRLSTVYITPHKRSQKMKEESEAWYTHEPNK